MSADAVGRWFDRVDQILTVDWQQVFPPGKREMSATGFYVRIALDNQITGGTSRYARLTRYNPALENAIENGDLVLRYDEDGDPVVRLPDGKAGYGRFTNDAERGDSP